MSSLILNEHFLWGKDYFGKTVFSPMDLEIKRILASESLIPHSWAHQIPFIWYFNQMKD